VPAKLLESDAKYHRILGRINE